MAIADRSDSAQAWTTFWSEQGDGSRCLANLHPDVRRTLNDHWSAFAASLAPAARLIDLGCGAGIVARTLLAAQSQLRITGIDLATLPPSTDPRFAIVSGTPMESLPFADAAFDAAVSQFGFEYSRVDEAARELARVLVPGSPISFLIHHSESSVVSHNRARNRALGELTGEGIQSVFVSGDAALLDQLLLSIMRQHPGEAIVGQLAQALRTHVVREQAQRTAIWDAVIDSLAPEREILGAMETCCVSPDGLGDWLSCLEDAFEIRSVSVMLKASGEAIAWNVEGVRKAEHTSTRSHIS